VAPILELLIIVFLRKNIRRFAVQNGQRVAPGNLPGTFTAPAGNVESQLSPLGEGLVGTCQYPEHHDLCAIDDSDTEEYGTEVFASH
jgi:hypothetical protein